MDQAASRFGDLVIYQLARCSSTLVISYNSLEIPRGLIFKLIFYYPCIIVIISHKS